MEKSWNCSTAEITNHAMEVPIISYLLACCSDLAMGGGLSVYVLVSQLQ